MITKLKQKFLEILEKLQIRSPIEILIALAGMLLIWLLRRWLAPIAACAAVLVGLAIYMDGEKERQRQRHLVFCKETIAKCIAFEFGNAECKLNKYVDAVPTEYQIFRWMEVLGTPEVPVFRIKLSRNPEIQYDGETLRLIKEHLQSHTVSFWPHFYPQFWYLCENGQPIVFTNVDLVQNKLNISVVFADSAATIEYIHDVQDTLNHRPDTDEYDEEF